MSLRSTALVAGVIGALLLAAGLVAESQRPPRHVTASASVDTAIVVYEAEMVAFAGDSRIAVSGEGPIVARTARPADAEAWLADHEATLVTGLPTWETLSTEAFEAATASPSPSASPSASEEPAEESSPSPSPSASPSAGEDAESEPVDILAQTSQDHWRAEWRGEDRLSIRGSDVPPGETLVIVSSDGTDLTVTDLALTRDVDDGWIAPLIWWGAFLLAVGVIALVLRFVDLRPAQARGEEWMAKRQRAGGDGDEPRPRSRRARRANGEHLPEASLDEDEQPASASSPASPSSDDPEPRAHADDEHSDDDQRPGEEHR
ncbi:hypothetical protein ACNI3K_05470 [Demequina sp. SO4-13]|uniref:hypothetical protein n=1 Tax=Demequina sp. SO4-13 TaxID=3401027 RepID=UPI003AF817E4